MIDLSMFTMSMTSQYVYLLQTMTRPLPLYLSRIKRRHAAHKTQSNQFPVQKRKMFLRFSCFSKSSVYKTLDMIIATVNVRLYAKLLTQ